MPFRLKSFRLTCLVTSPNFLGETSFSVSRVEQTAVSIKRASDISPFHLEPRGPLGPLMFPSC